uniref:Secreted protein n=1 Tax=Schistocephalus solidus TaxID=70667 RepID=A0A183SCQ4_SCHSO
LRKRFLRITSSSIPWDVVAVHLPLVHPFHVVSLLLLLTIFLVGSTWTCGVWPMSCPSLSPVPWGPLPMHKLYFLISQNPTMIRMSQLQRELTIWPSLTARSRLFHLNQSTVLNGRAKR